MKSLLDQFIPASGTFRPSTATELFALRLAQKLNDAAAVRHYVNLVDSYSEAQLLSAYQRTMRGSVSGDLGRRFHAELERIHGNGHHHGANGSMLAIRVERRTVAVAIFHGCQLEYTDTRQLSSARDKALASAVGFVAWVFDRFPIESSALEGISNGHEFQRRVLHDAICQTLRDRTLPIWEMPKSILFEGFGQPALKSRSELREIATTIWPVLSGTRAKVFIQDAAVLGLHVQTERLFNIN